MTVRDGQMCDSTGWVNMSQYGVGKCVTVRDGQMCDSTGWVNA